MKCTAERVESTLNGRLRLTFLTVYRFVWVVSSVFLITTEKARILKPNLGNGKKPSMFIGLVW